MLLISPNQAKESFSLYQPKPKNDKSKMFIRDSTRKLKTFHFIQTFYSDFINLIVYAYAFVMNNERYLELISSYSSLAMWINPKLQNCFGWILIKPELIFLLLIAVISVLENTDGFYILFTYTQTCLWQNGAKFSSFWAFFDR